MKPHFLMFNGKFVFVYYTILCQNTGDIRPVIIDYQVSELKKSEK